TSPCTATGPHPIAPTPARQGGPWHMNRRTALFLTLLSGGLLPPALWAQSRRPRDNAPRGRRSPSRVARRDDEAPEPVPSAAADRLKIRVRFVAAADPRWRYPIHSRLNPMASGPQGQQVWSVKVEDAAMVMTQMGIQQGFKLLADQTVQMINGQTLDVKTLINRDYVAGLQ